VRSFEAVRSAIVPIRADSSTTVGELAITVLPDSAGGLLIDSGEGEDDEESVHLLEGTEYRFELRGLPASGPYLTDRPELFRRSTPGGSSGRIRTGLYTGTVHVRISGADCHLGSVDFEVRTTKLSYEDEYRWMLGDLAESLVEVVAAGFAPAMWTFDIDPESDVRTSYQQFAFLNTMLDSDLLTGAMGQIGHRPYRTWLPDREQTPPGMGMPGSSRIARQLTAPGPRVTTQRRMLGLESLPSRISVTTHHASIDNPPNRFVKFALQHWLRIVDGVYDHLASSKDKPSVRRGLAEVARTGESLRTWLALPIFLEVGKLRELPTANQVLQRREGYREVYHTFFVSELAARLSWPGGSDTVYPAGSRNVATLYEYWSYMELAQIVSSLCGSPLDLSSLVETSKSGFELVLRRGAGHAVHGTTTRLGRQLDLELWFNRTFSAVGKRDAWTRGMRPDCSLRISEAAGEHNAKEVWLHFDAKYRVDGIRKLFGPDATDLSQEDEVILAAKAAESQQLRSTRSDLLKMHAYRDAIRRTSGAYVLYPGEDEGEIFTRYREILPGLGAFPLRPVGNGETRGTQLIRTFLDDSLTHLASTGQ